MISRDFHEIYHAPSAFKEVNIVLPETWSGSDCVGTGSGAAANAFQSAQPDFVVEDESPIFGVRPHSQRFGGCGTKGRQGVRVPFQMLAERNITQQSGKHLLTFTGTKQDSLLQSHPTIIKGFRMQHTTS